MREFRFLDLALYPVDYSVYYPTPVRRVGPGTCGRIHVNGHMPSGFDTFFDFTDIFENLYGNVLPGDGTLRVLLFMTRRGRRSLD